MIEEVKKFSMKDENFKCEVCSYNVNALGYTARNHCPKCLSSKHLDENPGDRKSLCNGILKPVAIEPNKKDEYKINHLCQKCGMIKKNKKANDDDFNLIIKIMSNPKDINVLAREIKAKN